MNKRQVVPLLLSAAVLGAATWLFPPWIAERRTADLSHGERPFAKDRDSHARSAGYAWRFTGPARAESERDSEWNYRIDNLRLGTSWILIAVGLCLLTVGSCPELIQLETARTAATSWRGRVAARIPALIGGSLILAWVLPIQIFLLCTLDSRTWFPVLGLTAFGLALGHCLPAPYFRLRHFETDGGVYSRLGARQFRNLVSNGDLAIRLMRWIDPTSSPRLSRSTLDQHEARRRLSERLHWGYLFGSLPTMAWAVIVQEPGFAMYLSVANVPFNVYPIMLQRYTRARLARIQAHARSEADRS